MTAYSFLPWLRSGIAGRIAAADLDPAIRIRASLPIDIVAAKTARDGSVSTEPIHRDVSLYGPGDIIGIDARAIIKNEPRNWITNFEANYLPYVEIYDEDFPWRYTPAAADGTRHRLRPWIALVVLAEAELVEGKNIQGRPLPYFELTTGVDALSVFPHPNELWAWAHVHVNGDLSAGGGTIANVLDLFAATVAADADRAYARILCPRRLLPDTGYHAFLIPSFETGRLAGLGLDIDPETMATASAWDSGQTQFPFYYRWYFRTGSLGDFEYLVKLLEPRPVDPRVGLRDFDVLHPGSNLPPIDLPAELGGVLKLGGALRVPLATLDPADLAEFDKFDQWDEPFPHPFETAMAERVNLADDYTRASPETVNPDGDPDPVVTSPLYGRWHALTNRVLKRKDGSDDPQPNNWVHRMNLDPRYRLAAGFGTKVVQRIDDELMEAAWEQVGDVLAANRRIRFAQLASATSSAWHRRHIAPLPAQRAMALTAPLQRRVIVDRVTARAKIAASVLPTAAVSAPFRKIVRPGTPLAKRLSLAPAAGAEIVQRVANGQLEPAPPKLTPPETIPIADASAVIEPKDQPAWVRHLLAWCPGLSVLHPRLRAWKKASRLADSLGEEQQTPRAVDALPKVSSFAISVPGEPGSPVRPGTSDSEEAVRFKRSLRDAFTFTSLRPTEARRPLLDVEQVATEMVTAIDPATTIPDRLAALVKLPVRIRGELVEPFAPVMAYPVFKKPMYEPLSAISSELLLPRIDLVPPNSITLLESNQKFIEAYMVGLNHEMSRELLWNEYPTDQRGSYFRRFWGGEQQADITELHRWSLSSALGTHSTRGPTASELVLVVRGELLKRYPTAVIYAHKAQWHTREDGTIDVNEERELVEIAVSEEAAPPRTKLRRPLFEAKVEPDIFFFGFDLKAEEAKGGTQPDHDAGWFFVIKERPGEPRFGMDAGDEVPRLINWNNLAWSSLAIVEGAAIRLDRTLSFDSYDPGVDQENRPDPDDAQAQWSPQTNAADLAYILYRVPVLVALHASRMLK